MLKVAGAIVLFSLFLFAVVVLFTWPAMLIWNACAVPVFGAPVLSFWQTFFLLVLAKIIVGNVSASAK